ncbi:hypothetical protein [Lutibacter sp. B1]|uniref:hypothetical protein n=1 Tax=Lutibacter sp. B1 TaxID=2725996 RepID=UPI0014578E85|nr:hypothetical protein [Lutibacter sp. B1]NLP58775.1 hypothetical protein [Lutibacter sp. B1]
MNFKLLYFCFFTPLIIFSQQEKTYNAYRTQNAYNKLIYKITKSGTALEEPVEGSPYYFDNFQEGKILIKNIPEDKIYSLRYNAFTDEVEVQNNNGFDFLIKNTNVSLTIGTDKYIYFPFQSKEKNKNIKLGFFKCVFNGKKIMLLESKRKKIKEGKKAQTSLTNSFPSKYVDHITYYLVKNSENIAKPIKLRKKEIISTIDSKHQKEMASFIKENQLNLKSINDLITFFKHYNSLLNEQ